MLATRVRRESYTVDYAGFWVRFFAFLIDTLILVGIVWLYNGIWGLASGKGFFGEDVADTAMGAGASYWALSSVILFLILVTYFICFWRWRGQTPGKMVMRISIVRFDGSRIGWGGAVLRFLGYIISVLLILTGFFWVAFDMRRQGFHDKIADTFVISIPRGQPASARASRYESDKAYEENHQD